MTRADWLTWKPRLQSMLGNSGMAGSGPQWVWANGMPWRGDGLNANQAAQAMLRHRSATRAVIVAVAEDLRRLGFPVEGVSQLVVVGPTLPVEWQSVARKISGEVIQHNHLAELELSLKDWVGETSAPNISFR